jgi:hypothetical protein
MTNDVMRTYLVYKGPLGLIVYEGASFFASKDGFPMGTCDTFKGAMETLAWKARSKASADSGGVSTAYSPRAPIRVGSASQLLGAFGHRFR